MENNNNTEKEYMKKHQEKWGKRAKFFLKIFLFSFLSGPVWSEAPDWIKEAFFWFIFTSFVLSIVCGIISCLDPEKTKQTIKKNIQNKIKHIKEMKNILFGKADKHRKLEALHDLFVDIFLFDLLFIFIVPHVYNCYPAAPNWIRHVHISVGVISFLLSLICSIASKKQESKKNSDLEQESECC